MDDLLSKLTNLRAQSFAAPTDKTGLDKPELIVSASFDQGKFERVRCGEAGRGRVRCPRRRAGSRRSSTPPHTAMC